MPKFSYDNIWYSSEKDSNEQILGKFLKLVKTDAIRQQNYTTVDTVTPKEYASLLQEYYMVDIFKEKTLEDRSHSTYAQYQFWLKSLVKLIKEMEGIKGIEVKSGEVISEGVKQLRSEVAKEILQFCSYIICVSVDQAKLSQDTMKEVMTELKKHNLQKHNLEEY